MNWPENVGIINMEIYFPSAFVDQAELETFDGVSSGKYTIGLGQTKMGFCTDLEDVNSLCLTVVDNLMRKTPGVDYKDIGRLEVGTETILDKSKSVKSVLMKLFEESGNSDVEGIDCTNACYGGTAALFNSVSWIESSYWDGRYALAVCADIAVYASGNARPTGGAGAVAMLIGPNAGLVLDRGLRASHVQHVYDFYKPDLNSEYPTVDGKLSIQCYLSSLDKCYKSYRAKALAKTKKDVALKDFDAILFHSPFCKLVQKSLARLTLNEFVNLTKDERLNNHPELKDFINVELEKTYFDRDVEKAFMTHSSDLFKSKTKPTLKIATNVGNMYTPSLYGGLVSYLISKPAWTQEQDNLKVALFSYGSGSASSFFSLRINADKIQLISKTLADVDSRLESRRKISPSAFSEVMALREKTHHSAPYIPQENPSELFPGTWYLTQVDDMHRRTYDKIKVELNGHHK